MKQPRRTEPSVENTPSPAAALPEPMIEKMAETFRMLSDPSRLKIVLALLAGGRQHVTALREILGPKTTQPAVSHHLTLMRLVDLVDYDREGKHNYYFLAGEKLRELFDQFFDALGKSTVDFGSFTLTYTPR
jgi:DNA-binding transcriptional ArsR family regulator